MRQMHSRPVGAAFLGKRQHRQDKEGYGFYIAYHTLEQHEQPAGLDVRWQEDAFESLYSFQHVIRLIIRRLGVPDYWEHNHFSHSFEDLFFLPFLLQTD